MKKENIQSRNRKLSAKARKKHTSLPFGHSDMMLKPLEKMYGYGAMAAAGMSSMAGMAAPYYGMHHNLTEAQFGSAAAAGMHHHPMAGTTFSPSSFGAMVRLKFLGIIRLLTTIGVKWGPQSYIVFAVLIFSDLNFTSI